MPTDDEEAIVLAVDAITNAIESDLAIEDIAVNLGVPLDDFIERISTELRARLTDG